MSLDNCGLYVYAIYVVVGNAMPLPRLSTMTPARFEAHSRNSQKSIRPPRGKTPSRTNGLITFVRGMQKNFAFEAEMLLKTHESQGKITNFEGLFERKLRDFCNIRSKLRGLCKFVRQKATFHLARSSLDRRPAFTMLATGGHRLKFSSNYIDDNKGTCRHVQISSRPPSY